MISHLGHFSSLKNLDLTNKSSDFTTFNLFSASSFYVYGKLIKVRSLIAFLQSNARPINFETEPTLWMFLWFTLKIDLVSIY